MFDNPYAYLPFYRREKKKSKHSLPNYTVGINAKKLQKRKVKFTFRLFRRKKKKKFTKFLINSAVLSLILAAREGYRGFIDKTWRLEQCRGGGVYIDHNS